MDNNQTVIEFAIASHGDQVRKYTEVPYWLHLAEVAGIVATLPDSTPEMIEAAWLHDVVEDTDVEIEEVESRFGPKVAAMVLGLTEFSQGRDEPRGYRKFLDSMFLAEMPETVQTIKVADMISNSASIAMHDPKFAKGKYLFEIQRRMQLLKKADPGLVRQLQLQLSDSKKQLCMAEGDFLDWLKDQPDNLMAHDAEAINSVSFQIKLALGWEFSDFMAEAKS